MDQVYVYYVCHEIWSLLFSILKASTPNIPQTEIPTISPTSQPSRTPSKNPTQIPTEAPSRTPTQTPTRAPTDLPSKIPTESPSETPTNIPSTIPTFTPTKYPTGTPTRTPSFNPTLEPTFSPSIAPTEYWEFCDSKLISITTINATQNGSIISEFCNGMPSCKWETLYSESSTRNQRISYTSSQGNNIFFTQNRWEIRFDNDGLSIQTLSTYPPNNFYWELSSDNTLKFQLNIQCTNTIQPSMYLSLYNSKY